MVLRDCGAAITTNQGSCNVEYIVVSYCNGTGIIYSSDVDNNKNVHITKCIISNNNNLQQRGIFIERAGSYNINNCYFNNNYYNIYIKNSNGIINNNEFDLGYYYIYFYPNCFQKEIHYNNFYTTISGLILQGNINNVNNNNFYGTARDYFISILSPSHNHSLVSNDVNATNNYWATEAVSQYLADAEDDPICPYNIIYLPKLSKPVKDAGIR